MMWLLQSGPCLECTIHYDSAYQAGVASQCFDVTARPIIGTFLADISLLLRSRSVATWSHVQGHCGNPWNELVDSLCSSVLDGSIHPSMLLSSCAPLSSWSCTWFCTVVVRMVVRSHAARAPCTTKSYGSALCVAHRPAGGRTAISVRHSLFKGCAMLLRCIA